MNPPQHPSAESAIARKIIARLNETSVSVDTQTRLTHARMNAIQAYRVQSRQVDSSGSIMMLVQQPLLLWVLAFMLWSIAWIDWTRSTPSMGYSSAFHVEFPWMAPLDIPAMEEEDDAVLDQQPLSEEELAAQKDSDSSESSSENP